MSALCIIMVPVSGRQLLKEHEYYRLLTCTFIHFGISHLFNNMLVLAYIGDNLERALWEV